MLLRRLLGIGAIMVMAGSISCSRATDPVAPLAPPPEETGDGFLTIRTENVAYPNDIRVDVAATVENHADRVLYAPLGDFYGGLDQPQLYAVRGSYGSLEKWEPPSWQSLPQCVAIEGPRLVALRPHSTYKLWAGTFYSEPKGRFTPSSRFDRPPMAPSPRQASVRIRLGYFDDAAMSADKAHQDFSNTFVVTLRGTR